MGRAENRKRSKSLKRKMTEEQFKRLQRDSRDQFINEEVDARCQHFQSVFADALDVVMAKNGISKTKSMQILKDIELEFIRRGAEVRELKKNVSE